MSDDRLQVDRENERIDKLHETISDLQEAIAQRDNLIFSLRTRFKLLVGELEAFQKENAC